MSELLAYKELILASGLSIAYIVTTIASWFTRDTERWEMFFRKAGLRNKNDEYPIFKKKIETDKGYKLLFTLPEGMCLSEFIKHKESIEQFLNARNVDIEYKTHRLIFKVTQSELKRKYPFELIENDYKIPIVIGYSQNGLVKFDLSKGEPHILIAGESGSGKSTLLRGIITTLLCTSDVKLHLVDLKYGAEFNIFEKCKNVISFSKTVEEAEQVLCSIIKEVARRYTLFYENECVDINDYNNKFKHKQLDRQVIIIDEFADLKEEKDSMDILEIISAKARACGIHLILATQRPDSQVITGRIKANISITVGLKTRDYINSRVVGIKGLEKLRGYGNGALIRAGKCDEIQAMYITPQEAKRHVKHLYVNKKPKKTEEENKQIDNFDFLKEL